MLNAKFNICKTNYICKNISHMDCYEQAHMNIDMITREVIRQYKEQKKVKDGE